MTLRRPARIMVLGAGGREHALAWKLVGESGVQAVWVAPGSAGIASDGRIGVLPAVDPLDGPAVVDAARAQAADLVVIGPEAPLAAGVADVLRAAGIPVFGPGAAAARIETSKAFCHEIAAAAGVRMARSGAFARHDEALAFARELARPAQGGVVIKADGLAAGKGVTVCDAIEQAALALEAIFAIPAPAGESDDTPRVVVEERLYGPEASLIALCDGRDALALPPARDHKRLLDGDLGPNTGGMGAYSPLIDLPDDRAEALVATVHRPILAELARRGMPFIGALYAGLILTDDGPVLLECNARFGDPETQVLLPRLAGDLAPLLLAAAEGRLAEAGIAAGIPGAMLPSRPEAAVGIVLAAEGYPVAPKQGDPIAGIRFAEQAGGLVFHAGTSLLGDDRFQTAGGRVLAVVALGVDLPAARLNAERCAERVGFRGLQRRNDIAAIVAGSPASGAAPLDGPPPGATISLGASR